MERICLGAIVGVHGIKGEVKLKSFTALPEDIVKYGKLEDKSASRKFELKIVGHSKELLRAKIKGVDDRNTSESLIGTELYADRSVLPELDEEEFYHADLIGLKVKLRSSNEEIGTVNGIYNFGSGDVLEIKLPSTGKTEMIPFTKAYVPEINIKNGYIIVESVFLNFDEEEDDES